RIILLHGPVGSAKSTIVRLLKRGLEEYTRTPQGALYTFEWTLPKELHSISGGQEVFPCPMHEEPLRLVPMEWREEAFKKLDIWHNRFVPRVRGDLDPACRMIFRELMEYHGGDWSKVIQHIR